MKECAICYEPTRNVVMPCEHAMCRECVLQWLSRDHVTCPYCKGVVVCPSRIPLTVFPTKRVLTSDESSGRDVGLTLVDAAPGVMVQKVLQDGLAFQYGLRRFDRVTHINNIPVRDHRLAIRIVDAAAKASFPLSFTLLPPRPQTGVSKMWRRLCAATHACLRRRRS